jgi:DNA (cytosine-5)-methyltransferase 1
MSSADAPFKFIDLFAGIGGLRIGFEAIGGQCVFTSEWNKFAQETYRENFPHDDHKVYGDITKIDENDIPEYDVLLAGFPCQPFSIAGVSKKNSLGRAHGFADETQDYDVDYRVIDAQSWVPQHRERIFIVGFRRDYPTNFTMDDVVFPDYKPPKLGDILHPEDGSEIAEEPFTEGPQATVASKYTLTPKLWEYLQKYAAKHKAKGNGFGFGLRGPEDVARTLSARYYKDGSEILIAQSGGIPRRLTPRECARLMGFDKPGSNHPWIIPVSDTQAYRQFGNAVAAPAVAAVANAMEPWLRNTVALRKPGKSIA